MTSTAGEAAGTSPAPHCYRHPDRETYIGCTRCGKPICPECMIPAAVGHQCPSCVHDGAKTVRQPRTAFGATISSKTPVTTALIVINVVLYLVTAGKDIRIASTGPMTALFDRLDLVPAAVDFHHGLPGQWYRLVTSMFLHYFVLHLLFNMWALFVVGSQLEQLMGRWRFLTLYLVSGLGGSVATYLFASPFGPVAGASGAIFGLFAAYFVIVRRLGGDTSGILWTLGLNLVLTFTWSGISKTGHLGGMVVGGVVAAALVAVPRATWRAQAHAGIFAAALVAMAVAVVAVPVSIPPNLLTP